MELLGSSSINITMNIYAHVLDDATRKLADRMAGLFGHTDVTGRRQRRRVDLHMTADLLLRRQDSNLDHRNQNPRCCRYTTADRSSSWHGGERG
jgi:hypothetical protein